MYADIREAALGLGFSDARPVTGHPFDVWRKRLSSIPLGKYLSFEHDPVNATGWPLEEITIWAAVAPTPPMAEWPDGCGELGAFYMCSQEQDKRRAAWEDAAADLGYEVARGVMLPERAAAIRAGLGVHGLNGLLITPEYGSFVNITVLLLHVPPPPDARGPEHDLSPGCGNCGECARGCPTGAISDDGVDTIICLRNYINRPELMSAADYVKMDRRIQGCDTCQQVCPRNADLEYRKPPAEMVECMKLENLLSEPDLDVMSKYIYHRYIPKNGVRRQAVYAAANTGRRDLLPLIESYIGCGDEMLDKAARWAANILSM